MKVLKVFCLTVLIMTGSAKAGLISDFTLDEANNIVTDSRSNLEWLQWDETDGISINKALELHASDGWVLATNAQLAYLFNTFDFAYGGFVWGVDENVEQSYKSPTDGLVEDVTTDRELIFVNLFGNTFEESSYGNSSSNGIQYSAAFFGTDSDGDGFYRRAWMSDDYSTGQNTQGDAKFDSDKYLRRSKTGSTGVALVRNAEIQIVNSTVVNEPTSFAIFTLALLGLSASTTRRFRH